MAVLLGIVGLIVGHILRLAIGIAFTLLIAAPFVLLHRVFTRRG